MPQLHYDPAMDAKLGGQNAPQMAPQMDHMMDYGMDQSMAQTMNQHRGSSRYPEFIDTDEYKPSNDLYFDTKDANKIPKDQRLNYFLPPIDDSNKKTSLMYPTVIDDEMIMTAKGIVPRTSRVNGNIKSYNGPVGRLEK